MDVNVNIDQEQVISLGQNIMTKGGEYLSCVKNIYDIVDDLKTAWQGEAAERYAEDIESFKNDYERLGSLILQFGDVVNTAGSGYDSLESDL